MSVISKDLAGRIATKLTEKSRVASDSLHVEFRELVTKLYEDQTPQEVKECFENNSDWFYTRSQVVLDGSGFRWDRISTTRAVIANSGSDCHLRMTAKGSDKLTAAKRKWEKAKKEYEDLKSETAQALLTLKTYNNIRKELPDAASMLPPPLSNALIVNFDSLQKKLSKQPEIKKESETVNQK